MFELFFETLASLSKTADLVQMFDSTVVRAHVSAAGAKGGKRSALAIIGLSAVGSLFEGGVFIVGLNALSAIDGSPAGLSSLAAATLGAMLPSRRLSLERLTTSLLKPP